jgi:hypothetical protein
MSDDWGSASGIEGNYEDDDKETTEETETTETRPSAETRVTSSSSETKETSKTNIKDEWNGRTIYIPDSILDDMEDTYLESQLKLRKAGRDEFKKNRHFYPLLVQLGLEALSDTEADEIQARLSDIADE